MDDQQFSLADRVFDALIESRPTIRVVPSKPASEGVATFFVSFLLNIDAQTHTRLRDLSDQRERSVPKLLRRYIRDAFRQCFSEDVEEETELKEAA